MPTPAQRPPFARMRLWATAHLVDDFYQGLVPAAVPYFVLERHVSYLGASGLALAATLGSAVPQLLVGVLADRRELGWLAPLGVTLAGIGAGAAGLAHPYPIVFCCLLLSGLGVAMFHPPAGRNARREAGGSTTAMSWFAAGGSVGFFVAPALVTPALDTWGVGATVLFIPPAVLVGWLLLRHSRGGRGAPAAHAHAGADRPRMFALLTGIEVVRSVISFGVNTFVSLYWIRQLGSSPALGGTALTLELAGGVLGTLLGGRIADRIGTTRTVRWGNALLLPALVGMLACGNKYGALPLVALVGLLTNVPFSVLVKLGQDYLPSRPGTAAGVTLGLAVSAGGLAMPLLGLVATHHGPRSALMVLAALPVLSTAAAFGLREPDHDPPPDRQPVDPAPVRTARSGPT